MTYERLAQDPAMRVNAWWHRYVDPQARLGTNTMEPIMTTDGVSLPEPNLDGLALPEC